MRDISHKTLCPWHSCFVGIGLHPIPFWAFKSVSQNVFISAMAPFSIAPLELMPDSALFVLTWALIHSHPLMWCTANHGIKQPRLTRAYPDQPLRPHHNVISVLPDWSSLNINLTLTFKPVSSFVKQGVWTRWSLRSLLDLQLYKFSHM